MNFDKLVLRQIRAALIPLSHSSRAVAQENYMKNIAPFLGITTPDRRAAVKPLLKDLPQPSSDELGQAARLLFAQEHREYAYVACQLLHRFGEVADKNFLSNHVEDLLITKSWWDTVDALGSEAVSPLSAKYASRSLMHAWNKSPNIWLNRAAIQHQRGRRQKTDVDFVLELSKAHVDSREFFLVKAIGWALRDIAAFNKPAVRDFLVSHPQLGRVAVVEANRGLNR